jgi:peptidoglycan/LPS O-acetylase OafA/YrhL
VLTRARSTRPDIDRDSAPEDSSEKFGYQPALDGLRALAVLAIIAYHLNYSWAHGAFLGVDLFFIVSGFLITMLLVVEWQRSGTIGLRRFWARRARRLLPALLVTLVAVAFFTRTEVDPWLRTSVRNDGLASLGYAANWRFIASNQGYFQTFAAPSPLRHTWTLAIEEQFYLLWPLVALAVLHVARRRRALVAVCVVLGAISVAVMVRTYRPGEPLRAYYGTDSRIHVILAGAALAVVVSAWRPGARVRRALAVLGPLALAAMLVGWEVTNGSAPAYYHGGSVLHAAVACLVVVAALHPGPLRAVMGVGLLAWIGRLSYGLYLFHWPIIVWLVPTRVPLEGRALDAARVALTFAAAITSYYLVELPVRERRPPTVLVKARALVRRPAGATPRRVVPWLVAPAVVTTAVAVLASAGGAARPPEYLIGDQSAATKAVALQATPDEEYHLGDPLPCGPPSDQARTEADGAIDIFLHWVPPGAKDLKILTVGDSAMCSFYPGIYEVAARTGGVTDTAAVIGCGVASGEVTTTRGEQITPNSHRCPRLVDAALNAAFERIDPDVVVWMSVWEKSDLVTEAGTLVSGTPEHEAEIQRRMDAALGRLTANGAHVVMLTVPAAAPNDAQGAANTSNAVDDASYVRLDGILHRFADRHPDAVTLVDFADKICPDGPPCPRTVSGILMRPDGRHLSPAVAGGWAAWLLPWMVARARGR